MRIIVAVCATVLLAAGLISQFVDAGIFSKQKGYETLANHLYKATESNKLVDNIKAAGSLLSEQPDSKQDVIELVQAFGSLKDDSTEPESRCSKDNLANLRRVAEGVRDGGNIGHLKFTKAINRLNIIIIDLIANTVLVCDPYLSGKWPKPWQPNFSDPTMIRRIDDLYIVSKSFSYEGFNGGYHPPGDYLAKDMSFAIIRGEIDAAERIDPDEPEPINTKNTTVIAMQLDKYVYKPCSEFVSFDESKEVLAPYNDMLKSWYVVNSGLLEKYYESKSAARRYVQLKVETTEVRELAFGHQACHRLLASPKQDLAERISKYRVLLESNAESKPHPLKRKVKNVISRL